MSLRLTAVGLRHGNGVQALQGPQVDDVEVVLHERW